MSRFIQPYLFFGGRCEEALAFYGKAIGAVVEMKMRFGESPQPASKECVPPGWDQKIMHSSFRVGETMVMASDGNGPGGRFEGFSLSLSVGSEAEAERVFAALAEGGKVTMPLARTFWSPKFGMLSDRFGMGWMVSVDGGLVK